MSTNEYSKGVGRVNEKQTLAFELYYSQGLERSYAKLAKEIKVSKATIARWAMEFNWQSLIKERDKTDADRLRDEVVRAKELALKVISAGCQQVLTDIESGSQKVLVCDFPAWVKAFEVLGVGETVESSQQATPIDTPETKSVIEQVRTSMAALEGGVDNG